MSFKEQIMSADKYPNIFSQQIEAIVFIIHRFLKLGDILGYSPVLAGEYSPTLRV